MAMEGMDVCVCVELSDTHNKICKMHFNVRTQCPYDSVHTMRTHKRFDMRNSYLLNVGPCATAIIQIRASNRRPDPADGKAAALC